MKEICSVETWDIINKVYVHFAKRIYSNGISLLVENYKNGTLLNKILIGE